MKKAHFILLLLLGFLVMPTASYACGKGTSHSCKKERKAESDRCCAEKHKDGKPCGGKCGHKACACTGAASAVSLVSQAGTPLYFTIFPPKKEQFSYAAPSVSDGFFVIWLIPKIG